MIVEWGYKIWGIVYAWHTISGCLLPFGSTVAGKRGSNNHGNGALPRYREVGERECRVRSTSLG